MTGINVYITVGFLIGNDWCEFTIRAARDLMCSADLLQQLSGNRLPVRVRQRSKGVRSP